MKTANNIILVLLLSPLSIISTPALDNADSLHALLQDPALEGKERALTYARFAREITVADPDSAIHMGFLGLQAAREVNSQDGLALNYLAIGAAYLSLDSLDRAMHNLTLACDNARLTETPSDYLQSWLQLGYVQEIITNYAASAQTYLEGLAVAEEAGDSLSIPRFLNNLAILQDKAGELKLSLRNYSRAATYFSALGMQIQLGYTLNNAGMVYYEMGVLDSARSCFHDASLIFKEEQDLYGLTSISMNMGDLFLAKDSILVAIDWYRHSVLLADSLKNTQLSELPAFQISAANASLGHALFLESRYDEAIKHLNIAHILAIKLNNYNQLLDASSDLAEIYSLTGNSDSSIHYFKLSLAYADSLQESIVSDNIARKMYRWETRKLQEKSAYERKLLEEKSRRSNLYFILALITVASVLLVAALIIRLQRSRLKRDQVLQKYTLLQNEQLEENIEARRKELVSSVMQLMHRNSLITEVADVLREIWPRAIARNKPNIRQALRLLENEKNSFAWDEFDTRFRQVNSEFYQRLNKQFPNLTPNEQKLCGFLYLNMTTKDISNLTLVSQEAVRVARYRLRKKLKLSKDQSISACLRQL
jgi:tetratricopeptide (TPR) repeat protein